MSYSPEIECWRVHTTCGSNNCVEDFVIERYNFCEGWAPEVEGTIRFDGCANWGQHENVLIHSCGLKGLQDMCVIFRWAYALAHDAFMQRGVVPIWKRPEVTE